MLSFARPICQAHGVVGGAHLVNDTLTPTLVRVLLPPRPPQAHMVDDSDRAPPSPAMAPAFPDRPIRNAWSLPRTMSVGLFALPCSFRSPFVDSTCSLYGRPVWAAIKLVLVN